MSVPGNSNKCSFIASVVECHACLLICLAHNCSLMLQACSVEESLFSKLMQSRSQVRGVGKWGILNLQILVCAIIIKIICMRQWYILCKWLKFLPKNERTFKEKCQHLKIGSMFHFVKKYFLKVLLLLLLLLLLLTAIGLSPGGSGYFTHTQIWKKSN